MTESNDMGVGRDAHADLKNLEFILRIWLGLEIKWFSPQVIKFY